MLLFTQPINSNRQLSDALSRVLQHPEVQYGILRITDGVTNGRIFIADGSVFVGAEVVGGKMGAEAVYRLLHLEDAIVGFLQVPFEPMDDSTFVDIRTLLFEMEQSPDIKLSDALLKIVGDTAKDPDTPPPAAGSMESPARLMADAIHTQVQKELGKKASDTTDGDTEKLLLDNLNYYNKLLSQLDRAPYKTWLSRAELLNADLVVYECLLEGEERQTEVAAAMNRLRETLTKAIVRAAETAALLAEVDTPYQSTSELFKPAAAPQAPAAVSESNRVDEVAKAQPTESAKAAAPVSSAPPPVSEANRMDKIAVAKSPHDGTNAGPAATPSPPSAPPPVSAANRVDRIAMPASSVAAKATGGQAKPAPAAATTASKPTAAEPPKPAPEPPKPAAPEPPKPAASEPPKPAAAEPPKPAPSTPLSDASKATIDIAKPAATTGDDSGRSASLADAWQKALAEAESKPAEETKPALSAAERAELPEELANLPISAATEEYEAFDDQSFPGFDAPPAAPVAPAAAPEEDAAPLLMQLTSLAASSSKEFKKPTPLGEPDDPNSSTIQTKAIKESDLPDWARDEAPAATAAKSPTSPAPDTVPAKPAPAPVTGKSPTGEQKKEPPKPAAAAKPSSSEKKPETPPPAPPRPVAPPVAPQPSASLDSLLSFDDEDESKPAAPAPPAAAEFDPDATLTDPVTAISASESLSAEDEEDMSVWDVYESPKQKAEAAKIDTSKPVRASALDDDLFGDFQSARKPAVASTPTPAAASQTPAPTAEETAKDTFSKLEFKPARPATGSQASGEAVSALQAKLDGTAPTGKPYVPAGKPGATGKTGQQGKPTSPNQSPAGSGAVSYQSPMGPDDMPSSPAEDYTREALNAIPTPGKGAPSSASSSSMSASLDAIPTPMGATPATALDAIPTPGSGKAKAVPIDQAAQDASKGNAADTFADGPSRLMGKIATSKSSQVQLGATPGARGKTNEALVNALSQMFEGLEIDETELDTIEEQARKAEEEKRRFKQEIAEAEKQQDMLSAAAIASIRTQEAQAADKELRTELKSLRQQQTFNKRYIIGGAAAGVLVLGAIVYFVFNPPGPSISGDIQSAKQHLKDNLRSVAREEIKMAIGKDPKSAEAHQILGQILFEDGEYAEALTELKQADSLGAKPDAATLHMMAESAIKTKNWKEARAITERQIKKGSTTKLQVQLGRIERDSGNWTAALPYFNKAISGGYKEAYRERGELYFKLKQPKKALGDLDQAIKSNDKDMRAHLLRGRCYLQIGDTRSALADFAKAQAPLHPDANVLSYQAIAYFRSGQYEKAIEAASKALDIDQNSVPAYMVRGDAFMALRTYQRAVNDFDQILQLDEKNPEAKRKRQAAYVAYRRSAGRGDVYGLQSESVSIPANLSGAQLVQRGYELLRSGQYNQATAYFTAALKKQPNDATARMYLGHALNKSGQDSDAAEQFRLADQMGAQMRPLDRAAWADSLLSAGQSEQAKTMFEQILQSSPKLLAARMGQLKAYIALGDRKKAESLARTYMVDSNEQEQEALSSLFRKQDDSPPPQQEEQKAPPTG